MTENHDLHDEIMSVVKEYVASEEFNSKIKSFTKKTVWDTVSLFWKYGGTVLALIGVLIVYIFHDSISNIETKLDKLASNQIEIVKIIAKLEERTK